MCNQKLDTKALLKDHVRNHFKPYVCLICDKELIGDAQYDYHINHAHSIHLKAKRSFKCRLCLERFSSDELLKKHVKQLHHKAKPEKISKGFSGVPVACNFCARIFSTEAAAIRHQLMTHSEDYNYKKFICDYCRKGFSRKNNLILHIRTHTGVKPFHCEKCPKQFANPSGLITHQRTHSGERPYQCPYCDKRYMHSTDLRRHRRSHGFEEKRFICDGCHHRFYEAKFLNKHLKHCNRRKEKSGNHTGLVLLEMNVQRQGASGEYVDDVDDGEEILS